MQPKTHLSTDSAKYPPCNPQVSSAAFRAFSCERFDTGREFLRADLSVECSTATHVSKPHEAAKDLAMVAIMIYPVGISVMYMFAFAYTRPAIRKNRHTKLSRAISFLSQDFEPEYMWWEARSCMPNRLSACALSIVVTLTCASPRAVWWQLIESWKKLVRTAHSSTLHPTPPLCLVCHSPATPVLTTSALCCP